MMKILPKDFGVSFKAFLDQVSEATPAEEPIFRKRLREHFGQELDKLPILTEKFAPYDHANLHVAIESILTGADCSVQMLGMTIPHEYFGVTLSMLVASAKSGLWGGTSPSDGPVEYVNVALDNDRVLACVQSGLYLVNRGNEPLAILMRGPKAEFHPMAQVGIEVMARNREVSEGILAEIRTAMRKCNVYRGHVLSLDETRMGVMEVKFHQLPGIRREGIILPKGLLERIERQTIRFSALSEKLLAFGRHLKTGHPFARRAGHGKNTDGHVRGAGDSEPHGAPADGPRPGIDRTVVRTGTARCNLRLSSWKTSIWWPKNGRAREQHVPLPCFLSCSIRWTAWPTTLTCCSC